MAVATPPSAPTSASGSAGGRPHPARQARRPPRHRRHHLRRRSSSSSPSRSSSSSSSARPCRCSGPPRGRPRRSEPGGRPAAHASAGATAAAPSASATPLVFGIDEYQLYLYELLPDGRVGVLQDRATAPSRAAVPAARLSGARRVDRGVAQPGRRLRGRRAPPTAASRSSRCASGPRYEEQKLVDLDLEVRDRGVFEVDAGKRPVREVDATTSTRAARPWPRSSPTTRSARLRIGDDECGAPGRPATRDGEKITHVRTRAHRHAWSPPPSKGNLYHWELSPEVRLAGDASTSPPSRSPRSSTPWASNTLIVGDATGALSRLVPGPPQGRGRGPDPRAAPTPSRPRGRPSAAIGRLDARQELRHRGGRRLAGAAPHDLGAHAAALPADGARGRGRAR